MRTFFAITVFALSLVSGDARADTSCEYRFVMLTTFATVRGMENRAAELSEFGRDGWRVIEWNRHEPYDIVLMERCTEAPPTDAP